MRPAKFSYLESDTVLAMAHRGGASAFPENTLRAFQHAVDLGYRYVETDVHATRDGVLLAFHDDKLDRVTNKTGVIAELDYAQVKDALVDGKEPIPLFDELLSSFPDLKINIDPKRSNAVGPLISVLQDHNAIDRVCVGAFSADRIIPVREALGPRLCTGTGPMATTRLRMASLSGPFAGIWGRFCEGVAQVPVMQSGMRIVDRAFVEMAHHCEIQVHVWTIDDPDEMNALLDLGVDGLMTDEPEVLRDVLDKRGEWR